MFVIIFQRVVFEALLDLIYFPVWWYGKGAVHAAGWCFGLLKTGNNSLAPAIWLENLFVPMFGQYDIAGRLISFFMRFAQIVARSLALFVWFLFCLLLFFVWLVLPVVVLWGIINSFKK